jgi:hypothetical protein
MVWLYGRRVTGSAGGCDRLCGRGRETVEVTREVEFSMEVWR